MKVGSKNHFQMFFRHFLSPKAGAAQNGQKCYYKLVEPQLPNPQNLSLYQLTSSFLLPYNNFLPPFHHYGHLLWSQRNVRNSMEKIANFSFTEVFLSAIMLGFDLLLTFLSHFVQLQVIYGEISGHLTWVLLIVQIVELLQWIPC